MHWKRVRNDIATLAEEAYSSVLQWARSTRPQRRASNASDSDAPDSDPANPQSDAQIDAFAQLVQRIIDGKAPEIDWINRWVEEHGEDAWLSFMTQWERVSREVVDEMMSDRRIGRRKTSKEVSSMMHRLEQAAQAISEGVVNVMMDSSDAKSTRKPRGKRRKSHEDAQ